MAFKAASVSRENDDARHARRNWTTDEVLMVLEHLKEISLAGKKLERPNARVFYEEVFDKLNIENCSGKSIMNKVRKLKSSYERATKWKRETGARLHDKKSISENLLKICPFFELLDELYGSSFSVTTPHTTECGAIDDISQESMPAMELSRSESPAMLSFEPICECSIEVEEHNGFNSASTSRAGSPSPNKPRENKKRKACNEDLKMIILKQQQLQKETLEQDKKRLDLDMERHNFEKEEKNQRLQLDLQRHHSEEEFKKQNLALLEMKIQLKREEMEKAHELELKKFQIEKRHQLKLEILKLCAKGIHMSDEDVRKLMDD